MSTLTAFYEQMKLNQLKQSVLPASDVGPSSLSREQQSEILHVLTTTTRSRIASVIQADLALPVNRIDSAYLCASLCYMLGPPPHPWGEPNPDYGHPVLRCQKDNGHIFDTYGNYVSNCYFCHGSRHRTHDLLRNTIIRNAREAGFITTSEPSTFHILSEIVADPAQIKALFPRYNDGGLACLRRKALMEKLDDFKSMSLHQIRTAIAGICANNFDRVPPAKSDGVARRADGLLVPVDGKGKSFVFDVTGIHCTTKDVVAAQLHAEAYGSAG